MIVAVASGKGGTGKTTVAVNLAVVAGRTAELLDCDVEEPNDHLFFRGTPRLLESVSIPVPEIDSERCNGCGACSRFCAFRAIVGLKEAPFVFAELCHGCGGCLMACPQHAIRETARRIGVVESIASRGPTLIHGRLDVGVPTAPPLIRRVKAHGRASGLVIRDTPPGASCPVVSAMKGVNFVLLVAEPTPFGLHDLQLIVDLVRTLGLPFGVLVNRAGIGDDRVQAYCDQEQIPILLEIPEDRRIATACSRGEVVVDVLPEYRAVFEDLRSQVVERAAAEGAAGSGSVSGDASRADGTER